MARNAIIPSSSEDILIIQDALSGKLKTECPLAVPPVLH